MRKAGRRSREAGIACVSGTVAGVVCADAVDGADAVEGIDAVGAADERISEEGQGREDHILPPSAGRQPLRHVVRTLSEIRVVFSLLWVRILRVVLLRLETRVQFVFLDSSSLTMVVEFKTLRRLNMSDSGSALLN